MMIDSYTVKHLNAWLDAEIHGDANRDKVRSAMLAIIADDPEYWSSQSWWNVYDRGKCERLLS
jgi:TPP-dependent indolepyruvate ferredoxin oxidoreductase alpha subunit